MFIKLSPQPVYVLVDFLLPLSLCRASVAREFLKRGDSKMSLDAVLERCKNKTNTKEEEPPGGVQCPQIRGIL